MAYEFYVTIEGTKQGAFKGESPREAHKEKIPGLAYRHEIKSPRDVATGQASGKRQHGPITISKEWGAASPQIMQALVTNEVMKSVLFEFIKTNPESTKEEVYFQIRLTNATISNVRYTTGGGGDGASAGSAKHLAAYDTMELEEVSFTYQAIDMEHCWQHTSASDDWHQ
jgi:type VI secretion system secreted protein Hcp